MPNVFRNSPIDSLTMAVNSLQERQQEAQRGQMQMMQLESDLADKEAERKLMPQRLELEEAKLNHTTMMEERGMNIEVAKAGMEIGTQRLMNMLQLDEFTYQKTLRPYEKMQRRLEIEMMGLKRWALPFQLQSDIRKGIQTNDVMGLVKLAAALDGTLNSIAKSEVSVGSAMAKQGEAQQWFAASAYTQKEGHGGKILTDFHNKGQEQLFKGSQELNKEVTEESFISDTMAGIVLEAERSGDFIDNKTGNWTDKGDTVLLDNLKSASAIVYADKLSDWAFAEGKFKNVKVEGYSEKINVPQRIKAIREVPDAKMTKEMYDELRDLEDGLMQSIKFDGKSFKAEDWRSVEGAPANEMAWDAFHANTEAMTNFKTLMISNSNISRQSNISGSIMQVVDLITQKSQDIAGGVADPKAEDAIGQMQEGWSIQRDDFLKGIRDSGWETEDDTQELKRIILLNPEKFGIIGLTGDETISNYFYGNSEDK